MTHFLRTSELRTYTINTARAAVMARFDRDTLYVPPRVLVERHGKERLIPNLHVCRPDTIWCDLPERIRVVEELEGAWKGGRLSQFKTLKGNFMITTESFNPWHMLAEKLR